MNHEMHAKYRKLLDFCRKLPPTRMAVTHPCDESSLRGAIDAARLGLITPILFGPRSRIEGVATTLLFFWATQLGVIALGFLPTHLWFSFRKRPLDAELVS